MMKKGNIKWLEKIYAKYFKIYFTIVLDNKDFTVVKMWI